MTEERYYLMMSRSKMTLISFEEDFIYDRIDIETCFYHHL